MQIQPQQGQELIVLKISKTTGYWRWYSERKQHVRLMEFDWAKSIPGYRELNEQTREKQFQKYVEKARIVDCGRIPEDLPNTRPFRGPDGRRRPPTLEELKVGAEALLESLVTQKRLSDQKVCSMQRGLGVHVGRPLQELRRSMVIQIPGQPWKDELAGLWYPLPKRG